MKPDTLMARAAQVGRSLETLERREDFGDFDASTGWKIWKLEPLTCLMFEHVWTFGRQSAFSGPSGHCGSCDPSFLCAHSSRCCNWRGCWGRWGWGWFRDYLWASPDLLANAQLCSVEVCALDEKFELDIVGHSWTLLSNWLKLFHAVQHPRVQGQLAWLLRVWHMAHLCSCMVWRANRSWMVNTVWFWRHKMPLRLPNWKRVAGWKWQRIPKHFHWSLNAWGVLEQKSWIQSIGPLQISPCPARESLLRQELPLSIHKADVVTCTAAMSLQTSFGASCRKICQNRHESRSIKRCLSAFWMKWCPIAFTSSLWTKLVIIWWLRSVQAEPVFSSPISGISSRSRAGRLATVHENGSLAVPKSERAH